MKKLGVNTKAGANLSCLKENDNIFKKPIEFNKNLRRLTFLKNKNTEIGSNENSNKCDKTKVKEINDVFKNCMVALSHNKICTRNAFDIRIIDHLEDLVNLNDEEIHEDLNDELLENGDFNLSFTRASKAIEGATKVYGYRVEAIYDQTYNFLTNMSIAKQNDVNEELIDDKKTINELSHKKMKKRKLEFFQESSTLAKPSDITIDSLAVSNISVDTFFLKLNSTYDHSSGHGYLLPNLTLNNDLSIQFDGDIDTFEYKKRKRIEEKNAKEEHTNEDEVSNNTDINLSLIKQKRAVWDNNNNDEDNLMIKNYKKDLYLNSNILRDILFGPGSEDFNCLNICPELEYFKEEIKKHKPKRSNSKELEEWDDGDYYNVNEESTSIEKTDDCRVENLKMGLSLDEHMTVDNLYDGSDYNNNGNLGESGLLNSSFNNNNNNNAVFNDYKIEDLNIENVMQESLAFDNMNLNDSMGNHFNFSQSVLSFQQGGNNIMGDVSLPELMKSENKDFSLTNSLGGNINFNTQNISLFKNSQGVLTTKKDMISVIPDEDTLWNRNVMTFENRLNAIDVNSKFNYHYYIPSKLMTNGNFRNLMDFAKGSYKNKQTVLHNIINKKVKTSFDISCIDFENLYVEINDIELSTYDLWKKEKKKYISNALFSIDQTSYIFETKDNCINCVNTVTDKIMKFSKSTITTCNDYNTDMKLNVVLNEINDNFINNDVDDQINYTECKNVDSNICPENMEDIQDCQLQQGLSYAIDKFYNMDFEDIWQNENENISKQDSKNDNTSILQLHRNISHATSLGNVNIENISKFVDVSKIKKILCHIVKPKEKDKENENDRTCNSEQTTDVGENDKIVPYSEEKTTTFKDIINETKSKLNESEVNGTSIHMLFVCLLYTCNDQELLLEKMPNDEDFYVRYGLPIEYHINTDSTLMLNN
ncbi:condensin complex subunit 2, putative [Plasmodium malariae]|uniref:Condensin complex subunit 2 n=1 Tax=Plasmodium malariae TaxID=5858 RepID=A0A1C3L220_PLAMA|nr:condensin complex subunit 2, putative [Plasmodium malariae]